MNNADIQRLLVYRQEAGTFLSVNELQTIFDQSTFSRIRPFVTVPDATRSFNRRILRRIVHEPNNYLLLRWARTVEPQLGYTEQASPSRRYAGTPDQFYARFRVSRAGDFSLGMTMKKDAGETLTWTPAKNYYGFDYTSLHAQVMNKGRIRNLIVGDFQAQFGQGLTLGSVFGIGKNGEAVATMRRANLGFLPYTSLYEAGYFRGAALSVAISKHFTLHTLASRRGRDGVVIQDTAATTADYLSSFSYSGLHRTASEQAARNSFSESNLASVLQFKNNFIDAGLIGHFTHFNKPLIRPATVYNQFYFAGDQNVNLGGYLNITRSNYSFFSEVAQTQGQGLGLVTGVLVSATARLDLSMVYRRFEKNFYSFYSNAIAENSVCQNETGMYWGWKYAINKKTSVTGYVDLFMFPWLRYRSYAPSDGNEWLVRLNHKPSKTVSFFVQMRTTAKQRNTGIDHNLYKTDQGIKRSYWINCDYQANGNVSFRARSSAVTKSMAGKP